MQQNDRCASFRQITHKGTGFVIALFMVLSGLLFLCVGIVVLIQEPGLGVILLVFTVIIILFGCSMLLPHFRVLEFDDNEIRLKQGCIILAQYPMGEIQCLASGIVRPNPRTNSWETKIILLSTRSSEQILQIGKITVENAREYPAIPPYVGMDPENPAVIVDAFVKSKFEGICLERGEGLWLEFTAERAERLRAILPFAQDLMIA